MPAQAAPTKPLAAVERTFADAWRVGLTGLNAWLVLLLVPCLAAGWPDGIASLAAAGALALLALGVLAAVRSPADDRLAVAGRWVLLALAPAALAAMVAARTEVAARSAFGPATLVLGAASVLAYAASAARACTRPLARLEVSVHALRSKQPVSEPAMRRWMRRALLGVAALGAGAIALVAPTARGARIYGEAWGDSAEAAAVLTSVVASLVAALALGAIVGPALRAKRPRSGDDARRVRRIAWSAVVASLALGAYVALRLAG